jgi:hypothetical protein
VVACVALLTIASGCARAAADTSLPPLTTPVSSAPAAPDASQQAAYQAALTAYTGYMRVRVAIAAKPDPKTVTTQLTPYVADPLKVDLVAYVTSLKSYDEAVHGTPTWTVVSSDIHADTTPQTVDLHVCVNPDGWYTVWLHNGAAMESKHQAKYITVAHVEDYGSPYGWLVVSVKVGGATC